MSKDVTGNGLLVQEVPEGMVVTEKMGLSPESVDREIEATSPESMEPSEGLDGQEMKGILEALLHVSHEPLTLDKLVSIFEGLPKVIIHNALVSLQQHHRPSALGERLEFVLS